MTSMRRPNQPAEKLAPFPLMQTDEICNCLAALGISAHPDDFTRPTAQAAQAIYAGLLDTLMGAPTELMEGPRAALMGMMEYKELYSDALQFTMFYKHVRHLAQTCGVDDFSMIDLTRPEAQRIKRVLSGMMNFAKFREERMQLRDELALRVQESSEKTEKLRKKLDNLERTISDITAKNIADRPLTEQAKRTNEVLRQELFELRSQQVKLSHEVDEAKREKDSYFTQAQGKTEELSHIQSAISNARSRLVQSPDRIKRNISEMATSVSAERSTLSGYQNKAREHSRRLEVINGLELDIKALIEIAKGIEDQQTKVEEGKRSTSALGARLDGKKIELEGLETKLEQLGIQLVNAIQKFERQETNAKEGEDRTQKHIAKLKEEYIQRSKERGAYQKERERLLAEQKELDEEMAEFVKLHEGELNDLLEEYWSMRKQAENYMRDVQKELGLNVKVKSRS